MAAPYVDPSGTGGKAIGLLVGVSAPSGRALAGLGTTAIGGRIRPGPETVFEIGSVTKVYTGVLLGLAVERGQLRLEDSIEPFFPQGTPHFGTVGIDLLDLATHTSGLPNMPGNLHGTPGNPAAGYTAQDLAAFLANVTLASEPGTTFLYSNAGSGTLGHVLAQSAAAASYEALVKAEIAGPLGLADTTVGLTAEQQARAAQGHRNGQPAPTNEIGEPLRGGGALRATAEDLLRFVEASAGSGSTELSRAWQRVLQPQRPSPNGHTGLLLNVETWNGRTLYSKDGQTAGFGAQVLFTAEPPAAVVLLANTAESTEGGGLKKLGLSILSELP